MQSIDAPAHIVENPLHAHALIVLAMPVAAKNMHKALENFPRVRANLPRVLSVFCSVFRENSKRVRLLFFQNELVQVLWSRYICSERRYISKYFSEIINVEGKQSHADVLLKDILIISNRLNFQVINPELLQEDILSHAADAALVKLA